MQPRTKTDNQLQLALINSGRRKQTNYEINHCFNRTVHINA